MVSRELLFLFAGFGKIFEMFLTTEILGCYGAAECSAFPRPYFPRLQIRALLPKRFASQNPSNLLKDCALEKTVDEQKCNYTPLTTEIWMQKVHIFLLPAVYEYGKGKGCA